MPRFLQPVLAASALFLCACNPTFNWREVRLEASGLKALLPCKPDHGSRPQSLAGRQVDLQMMGCETGHVLFALAHVDLKHLDLVREAQEQWQAAMLTQLHAGVPQVEPWLFKTGIADLAPLYLLAQGRRQDGTRLTAHAVWFARGASLYHAVIYADTDTEMIDVADTFFSGLELQ